MKLYRQRKFTLVELLVVVAILGILASLLLPSLGRAREKARQVTCLSNQRQLGVAVFNYIDDNQYFPTDGNYDGTWRHKIFIYLGGELSQISEAYKKGGIFRCMMSEYTFNNEKNNVGVGYNRLNFGIDDVLKANGTIKYPAVRSSEVALPVETILIGDSMDDTTAFGFANQLEPPSKSGEGARSDPIIGSRHKRGINSVWADGHAVHHYQSYLMAGKNGDVDYYFLVSKP